MALADAARHADVGGRVVKRLLYMFDRLRAWIEPHCPDDWSDEHLDFDICCRCDRIKRRKARIAQYRAQVDFPAARTLT